MKSITVSVDDDTYRRARVRAAEKGVSVSALVPGFLSSVADSESEFQRLKRAEATLRTSITSFQAAEPIARDERHARPCP